MICWSRCFLVATLCVISSAACPAQPGLTLAQSPADFPTQIKQAAPVKTPYFLDPLKLPLASLIPSPPTPDSEPGRADLAEVHLVERTRTPDQVRSARYDDTHEDIFIYSSVVGERFNAEALPLTFSLSQHLRNDAGLIDNPLKALFQRLRPYNLDHSLHPICETNQEMSYPSGHSINGYLYAFTLAEILPDQHDAILSRADVYARNRVVCGSHYPSDTEASRRIASLIFGALLATPRFTTELQAVRTEVRQHLLNP